MFMFIVLACLALHGVVYKNFYDKTDHNGTLAIKDIKVCRSFMCD